MCDCDIEIVANVYYDTSGLLWSKNVGISEP